MKLCGILIFLHLIRFTKDVNETQNALFCL